MIKPKFKKETTKLSQRSVRETVFLLEYSCNKLQGSCDHHCDLVSKTHASAIFKNLHLDNLIFKKQKLGHTLGCNCS